MKEKNHFVLIEKHTILFFDMDGTLVDTNIANFLSYKEAVFDVVGKEISFVSYNPTERFNRSMLRVLFPYLTESDYEKIIQQKERCYKDYLPQTTLIKENIEILLKYFTTHRTVLVSNCRQDRVGETLSYHGLDDKFTDMFCRDKNYSYAKINKYQNAITSLGIAPDYVVAFENEQIEIADAVSAGIKIINPQILL